MSHWKIADGLPAVYTPEDPYDVQGTLPLAHALQSDWYKGTPDEQSQAIANAMRAAMLSPQNELKYNAVAYQALMHIPHDESDPNVYEQTMRDYKQRYDVPGQENLLDPDAAGLDPSQIIPGGKLNPPFWNRVRGLADVPPYLEDLREAALEDLATGGKGFHFRDVAMRVPGVGAKVASFAWLILQPTTSDLAAVDIWMMRYLGLPGESPPDDSRYFELEQKLRDERDEQYPDVPLGQLQWAIWDSLRAPGQHQDHSPLRVINPTPPQDVTWHGETAIERAQKKRRFTPSPVSPLQMGLQMAKSGTGGINSVSGWSAIPTWCRVPKWATPWRSMRHSAEGYTLHGQTAGTTGLGTGIAVRLDIQSREEIEKILETLGGHSQDYLKQRQLLKNIPEWQLPSRGGAEFQPGPGGVGITYRQGVIAVARFVDVNDNWLLENEFCHGIIAELGGRNSHGVVVARERNIPIVLGVDVDQIQAGHNLRIDGDRGVIDVEGGGLPTSEKHTPQEAEEPTVAWVWSETGAKATPIPPGAGGAIALHGPMMMELDQAGQWDYSDFAVGVMYANGRVEEFMQGGPNQGLQEWLSEVAQSQKGRVPSVV